MVAISVNKENTVDSSVNQELEVKPVVEIFSKKDYLTDSKTHSINSYSILARPQTATNFGPSQGESHPKFEATQTALLSPNKLL